MTNLYKLFRGFHLYLGLFISPFVVLFSVSVLFLVHSWLPGCSEKPEPTRVVSKLQLPPDLENLTGRRLIDALHPVIAQANVVGEIGWVNHQGNEHRFVFPVTVPGRITTVTLNVTTCEASFESRNTGLADAAITLHKLPGPHLVGMRMNWFYIRLWKWFADATVYLLFLVPATGVYLWYASRSERKMGLAWLVAGGILFFGIVYALVC